MNDEPRSCINCSYWLQTVGSVKTRGEDVGMCVRYPPQVVYDGGGILNGQLPCVNRDFKCGEWISSVFTLENS